MTFSIVYQNFGPVPLFIYGSLAYLLALLVIQLLNPSLEMANVKTPNYAESDR